MRWIKNQMKAAAIKAHDALAQGIDIMAPALYSSKTKEFQKRWLLICRYLASIETIIPEKQEKLIIESHILDILHKMTAILAAEERLCDRLEMSSSAQSEQGMIERPCLKYLMENEIVLYICELGAKDTPRGMLMVAVRFMTAFLEKLDAEVIFDEERILDSIWNLIQVAGVREAKGEHIRRALLYLLNRLWKQLRAHPTRIKQCFKQAESCTDRQVSEPSSETCVAFTQLLPHISADGEIGTICREALIVASGIPQENLVKFILKRTPLCQYVVTVIGIEFKSLAETLSGVDSDSWSYDDMKNSKNADLVRFKACLKFCCLMATVGYYEMDGVSIASIITTEFRDRFLVGPFMKALVDKSISRACTTTMYAHVILDVLVSCNNTLQSNPILYTFANYFLQENSNAGQDDPQLSSLVLDRIESAPSCLRVLTIDLLTSFLELDDPKIDRWLTGYEPLLSVAQKQTEIEMKLSKKGTMNFASRFPYSYIASNIDLYKQQIDKEKLESAEKPLVSLLSYIVEAEIMTTRRTRPPSISYSDVEASCLKGVRTNAESTELSSWMCDEHHSEGTADIDALSREMGLPLTTRPKYPPNSEYPSEMHAEATPRIFQVIFSRLENFLEASIDENLALSGLISILARNEKCFDRIFDMEEVHTRSIRSILETVHTNAVVRIRALPDGHERLELLQELLVGGLNESSSAITKEAEDRWLTAFIILQEILKELCSILYVYEHRGTILSTKMRTKANKAENVREIKAPKDKKEEPELEYKSESDDVPLDDPDSVESFENVSREMESLLLEAEISMKELLSYSKSHKLE
uniref:Uncharacterized protein AlNc14C4G635 n=1 Tax=Albugo laibachii Nc14 TaxID=890382 RepID=F0W0J3_9STRA|nr:conserved hypothetical protein [Albugo laibachii Nc14]|eukprot:CCA14565.1 conserved hypothetical protein [Albugo laibachii Nc14]